MVYVRVQDARGKGATILAGGRPRPDIGPYFASAGRSPDEVLKIYAEDRPGMSQLELLALQRAAGTLSQADLRASVKTLASQIPSGWHAPTAFYVLGLDLWTSPQPSSVKPVLDRDFPVPGYSLKDLLRGKAALGTTSFDDKTSAELALSPLVHVQKWRAMNVSELCCRTGAA